MKRGFPTPEAWEGCDDGTSGMDKRNVGEAREDGREKKGFPKLHQRRQPHVKSKMVPESKELLREEGRTPADIGIESTFLAAPHRVILKLRLLDILVNNAAEQLTQSETAPAMFPHQATPRI